MKLLKSNDNFKIKEQVKVIPSLHKCPITYLPKHFSVGQQRINMKSMLKYNFVSLLGYK